MLDFIKGDLGASAGVSRGAERAKLDSHLAGVRRVRARPRRSRPARRPDQLPGPPAVVKPNVSANHKTILDQYLGIIKLAFQLDLTRVVTFMFGSGNSQVSITGIAAGYGPSKASTRRPRLRRGRRSRSHALVLRRGRQFVLELQATHDVDGTPLLDNTLIVVSSEVGAVPRARRTSRSRSSAAASSVCRAAAPASPGPHAERRVDAVAARSASL